MNSLVITNPIGTANSRNFSCGLESKTPPEEKGSQKGQTVEIAQSVNIISHDTNNALNWFVIRATQGRAKSIYDAIESLNDGSFEPYLPIIKRIEYSNEDFDNPTSTIVSEPLDASLLFLRSTVHDFRRILDNEPAIPGLTPYYNHCVTNEFGRNDFLVVPDRQMESFRIIVESGNENIVVDQNLVPSFLTGDHVVVIGGPFAGVAGVVMKYKHQKRVFVELQGVGRYATAYVPGAWIRKV